MSEPVITSLQYYNKDLKARRENMREGERKEPPAASTNLYIGFKLEFPEIVAF